ncbi:MarR family winged helix-turn-helix transcriptional regulator [Zavarzinia compransoris]|nr:MarR family winged helix-turn-helix transcriptional regulator [Zavarzinia compransoris]TDP47806.1 DNA-binding MarR family transcriptional regulator [Zavarzinia compransoris]
MTDPTAPQIDALRLGIDGLIRRFKIAEAAAGTPEHRLNPIDVQALQFIAARPGCTATAVGQHLGVVATTTSALVDRLVRQGLATRQRVESNRRIVRLDLSAAGKARVEAIVETQNDHCRLMLSSLESQERAALIAAIEKIVNTIG